jgi:hypothetical protein
MNYISTKLSVCKQSTASQFDLEQQSKNSAPISVLGLLIWRSPPFSFSHPFIFDIKTSKAPMAQKARPKHDNPVDELAQLAVSSTGIIVSAAISQPTGTT